MAGEQKLSPSGLEKILYSAHEWHSILNRNFGIINWILSSLHNLLDVKASNSALSDHAVLTWDSTLSKWVPKKYI
jgi:hypothetical protein